MIFSLWRTDAHYNFFKYFFKDLPESFGTCLKMVFNVTDLLITAAPVCDVQCGKCPSNVKYSNEMVELQPNQKLEN